MKNRTYNYTKEFLEPIIEKSRFWNEFYRNLQLHNNGNYGSLKRYIKNLNLDTSHFLNRKEAIKTTWKEKKPSIEQVFTNSEKEQYSYTSIKKYIYKNNIFPIECNLCGQDENWRGSKFSLILDHIDGIKKNNELSNLRLLCPNCNATLPTHCGGNIKKGRKGNDITEFQIIKLKLIEQRKEIILKSKIDFSKKGWAILLGKEFNIISSKTVRNFVKINLPEFFEKECYKWGQK